MSDPARTSQADLARMRREYEAVGLVEDALPADPLVLFHAWLATAVEAALAEANAMVLSTVDADGRPSSRMVLCKGADERGFTFYTNYESRKGRDLALRPRAALLFPWHALGRQVRVEGSTERIADVESDAYFASRPRGAQVSAWASPQSAVVAGRAVLDRRVAEVEDRYAVRPVPRPAHWGGVRVVAETVEFWQGRRDRLHDRLVYRRAAAGAPWSVDRLAP